MSAQVINLFNGYINNYQIILSSTMKMTKGYLMWMEGMEEMMDVLYKDAFVPGIYTIDEE